MDSLGVIQLRKAYNLDPNRSELLSEIAEANYKTKNYSEAIKAYKEKIGTGKDASPTDYYFLGRAYYFNAQFMEADTAFSILNEKSANYASGWLWRAKANTHIDSTSELGLAKPHYEKYIEIVLSETDSTKLSRYNSSLIEAYEYLAYYYILKKDNENVLLYLQKKKELIQDSEEKKKVQDTIDQLKSKK